MKNCRTCRKTNCEYRNVAFKNMTIVCSEGCPLQIHEECKVIATSEFRKATEQLRSNTEAFGVINLIRQAECILNAADDIRA